MEVKMRATSIVWHRGLITRGDREFRLGQHGGTIWLTGLPASGKSTTAFALEYALAKQGRATYVLDGDNLRHGLNKDLAFCAKDRKENIRRVGEVARLFADAGLIVIASFISPYREEREFVRRLHRNSDLYFFEIFVDTPVDLCEARDPKGQYAKARRGELQGFTGVGDPYEPPSKPEMSVKSAENSPQQIAGQIINYLHGTGFLPYPGFETFGHDPLQSLSRQTAIP